MESSAKKMVTAEEFDAAVKQVIHDQVSDPKLDGMGKLLIPLTGAIFAKDVKKILFGKPKKIRRTKTMKFHEVSKAMDEGKKIKLKDWDNAYWYKKGGIIVNHDEEGLECDTREIFPFDLMWVADGDWEIVVENLTPMNFKEAFKLMKQGYPVKLPSWGGYWYWDAAKETIVMHTKDGRELDIRETKRVEYTTLNILSDEWVLASTKNCPAMGGEATFSFGEAIKYLKRGHKVARKGWNGKKQYIQLASGISYKAPTGDIVNCEHDAIGNMAVAFVGTSGVQMGWLASQADMLADDWVFAE